MGACRRRVRRACAVVGRLAAAELRLVVAMTKQLTFISLFSGVGGFDLGLERASMQCVAQVEINKAARGVLATHYPHVERLEDVTTANRTNLPWADVICGGFPCQDVSVAGHRAGFEGARSGLWHEFARIIGDVKPRWVVVENVAGLLSVNAGRDFGRILSDLSESGFDATWQVLRASDVGAPHKRERIFLVANRDGKRIERFWQKPLLQVETFSWCKDVRSPADFRGRPDIPFPLVRRVGNGLSFAVDALGNAVVPQLAEWIGRRIVEIDAD